MFFTISSKTNEGEGIGMMFKPSRSGHSRAIRAILAMLVLAVAGLLAAPGCTYTSDNTPSGANSVGPRVGQLAPDFTLTDLNGNRTSLSDFRGKRVFINFWATWCPPCREEMPAIELFHQEYKDRDVVVIGVDLYESEEDVRQYVQDGGYSWIFVIDTTGEVTRDYRVTGIPTSFFLDRDGVIRAVTTGAMTKKDMEANLAKAINLVREAD